MPADAFTAARMRRNHWSRSARTPRKFPIVRESFAESLLLRRLFFPNGRAPIHRKNQIQSRRSAVVKRTRAARAFQHQKLVSECEYLEVQGGARANHPPEHVRHDVPALPQAVPHRRRKRRHPAERRHPPRLECSVAAEILRLPREISRRGARGGSLLLLSRQFHVYRRHARCCDRCVLRERRKLNVPSLRS
jgi:hypothetical protein